MDGWIWFVIGMGMAVGAGALVWWCGELAHGKGDE